MILHNRLLSFLSLSRSLLFHLRSFLLPPPQRKLHARCLFFRKRGSSCREERVLVARTWRFSPSRPNIRAPALWRELSLLRRKTKTRLDERTLNSFRFEQIVLRVTSFQSLHCALASSICWPDLLS